MFPSQTVLDFQSLQGTNGVPEVEHLFGVRFAFPLDEFELGAQFLEAADAVLKGVLEGFKEFKGLVDFIGLAVGGLFIGRGRIGVIYHRYPFW